MDLVFDQKITQQFDENDDSLIVFLYELEKWVYCEKKFEWAFNVDELTALRRIKNEDQRRLSFIWRIILKSFLSQVLKKSAIDVQFALSESGKPFFPKKSGFEHIKFNASHTQSHGVLAISRFGPLGIDIESVDRVVDWESVANRFFSRQDRERLTKLPKKEAKEEFLRIWTRIEAIIKMNDDKVANIFDSQNQEMLVSFYPNTKPLGLPKNLVGHLACPKFPLKVTNPISVFKLPFPVNA